MTARSLLRPVRFAWTGSARTRRHGQAEVTSGMRATDDEVGANLTVRSVRADQVRSRRSDHLGHASCFQFAGSPPRPADGSRRPLVGRRRARAGMLRWT